MEDPDELDEYTIRYALSELAAFPGIAGIAAADREDWRNEMREWAALSNIPGSPQYCDLARIWLDLADIAWRFPTSD